MHKKLFLLVLFFLFVIKSNGQIYTAKYFNNVDLDTNQQTSLEVIKPYKGKLLLAGQRIYDYYSGSAPSRNIYPEMVLIDSNLNVLWNYSDCDTSHLLSNGRRINNVIIGSDDFLYTISNNTDGQEVTKVNPTNGRIVWRRHLGSYFVSMRGMLDLDSLRLLVISNDNVYFTINKQTGILGTPKPININPNRTTVLHSAVIDSNRIVYLLMSDSIYRIDFDTAAHFRWSRAHSSILMNSDGGRLLLDQDHSLYCFATKILPNQGSNEEGCVLKLNTLTGGLEFTTGIGFWGDITFADVAVKDSCFYLCYRNKNVGGGRQKLVYAKTNKYNGNLIWSHSCDFSQKNYPATITAGNDGATSIMVDEQNDVYISGYVKAQNYLDGYFAYFKVNGENGDTIYTHVVFHQNIIIRKSSGYGIFKLGTKYVCFGSLNVGVHPQSGYEINRMMILQFNPNNGLPISNKYIRWTLAYPSSTLRTVPYKNGIIALKQYGNELRVDYTDFNLNKIWEYRISTKSDVFTIGQELYFLDSTIYVTAYRLTSPFLPTNNSMVDSLKLFRMNNNGVLTGEFSLGQKIQFSLTQPLNVISFGKDSCLFFHYNYRNYMCTRIIGNNMSTPVFSGTTSNWLNPLVPVRSLMFKYKGEVYYPVSNSKRIYIRKVNFSTLTSTIVDTIITSSTVVINNGLVDQNNLYLVGGENSDGFVMSYSLNRLELNWQTNIKTTSSVSLLTTLGDKLIIADANKSATRVNVMSFDTLGGEIKWLCQHNLFGTSIKVKDLYYDKTTGGLLLGGSLFKGGSKMPFHIRLNAAGVVRNEEIIPVVGNRQNEILSIISTNDTLCLGGSIYRSDNKYNGFVMRVGEGVPALMDSLRLLFPADLTRYATLKQHDSIIFIWSSTNAISKYNVRINPLGSMLSLNVKPAIFQDTIVRIPYIKIEQLLNDVGVKYNDSIMFEWRVVAYDYKGDSIISAPFRFRVVRYPELLPIFLDAPNDNDLLVIPNSTGTIFFNWSRMKSPVSYKLKLGLLDVGAGVDSFIYLPQRSIDSLFKLHNKSFGDSLKTTWFVRATNQTGSLNSDTHGIVLLRRLLPDSFSLFYPSNKERFIVSKSSTDSIAFKWRSAKRGNYELQFLNNSGNKIFNKESNSLGKDTILTMSSSTLDSIVAANGINRGDSLSCIWTVFVFNSMDTIEARQRYQVTLVRKSKPNVFNLLQPANNSAYLPFQSATDSVVFKWSSTQGQYTMYLYNLTNQVLLSSLSTNNGTDTTLVLQHSILDSLANLQNTGSQDSIYLKWNVIASGLYDTLESSDKYNLVFIRSNSSSIQIAKNDNIRFSLTPNPTTSTVHVSIQESEGIYMVFDMFGRMLFQEKFKDSFDVDMNNSSHGFYTLVLTTNKGEVVRTRFKKM